MPRPGGSRGMTAAGAQVLEFRGHGVPWTPYAISGDVVGLSDALSSRPSSALVDVTDTRKIGS